MNVSLLKNIETVEKGILATILRTEGHTYKKAGEKALFAVDNPFALYGNLGSLCVDQDIVRNGKAAYEKKTPAVLTIDTSEPSDVHVGYGTYCGGMMEILLEPIFAAHRETYRQLGAHLEHGTTVCLCHDLKTGALSIRDRRPEQGSGLYVEEIAPRRNLFLVGATPLARQLTHYLSDMDFRIHVVDWRAGHLDRFRAVPHLVLHEDEYPFDERSLVLILTHNFERDVRVLREAVSKRCAYVGLLSSRERWNRINEALAGQGVPRSDLDRVSSPVGIDIHARTDAEIAIGILAEIVAFMNR